MQFSRYFPGFPLSIHACVLNLVVLFAISSSAAEFSPAPQAIPLLTPPSVVSSFLRVSGSVIFVIALFLGAIWLFKNWQRVTVRGGQVQNLRVLEVKSLGPRNAVYVIGYQRERLLLSSSPSGVTLVAHLPEADVSETASGPATISFSQSLMQALSHKS